MAVRRDEVNLQLTVGAQQAGNTLRDLQKEARDLRRLLERLPVGTKEFDEAAKRLKDINTQIAEANAKTKALSGGFGQVSAAGGKLAGIMQTVAGVFGGISLAGLVQGALQYAGTLFNLGTSLDSLKQKTSTVFGDAEAIVQGFAETNAQSLGLARQEYINLATSVGDLLIPMGFTQEAAANISSEIVNQAGVLSEWTGGKVSTAQASEILNKALLGERDALNQLGIDVKDSLIQDELKRKGLQDLTGESKRQAEALITLELVTKQSASANEAFANNQGSAVRQTAELRARVSEITQGLAQGFIPIVNAVLGALIPVVDYIAKFAGRLVDAYQKADTFRGIVTGVFTAIGGIIRNVASGIADIGEGFLNLFEGNFSAALDSFKSGFNNLNPFAIGLEVKNQFVAGFNSAKNPAASVDGGKKDAETKGKEFARAYGDGFDAEFENLKKNGERGGKAIADAAKKAFDARLKEIQIGYAKEELAADTARVKNQISEAAYARRILELKQTMYEQQLALFRQFNKTETQEAITAQRNLLELQAQLNRQGPAPLTPIATRQIGTPVSGLPAGLRGTDISAIGTATTVRGDEISILRDKFSRIVDAENENELRLAEIRLNSLNAKLEFLRNSGLQETELFKELLGDKLDAEEDFNKKRLDNERRTLEFKRALEQEGFNTTKLALDAAVELLLADEAARKKNAAAIKAFQTASVTVSGISEVQKIWEKAAEFGPFQAIIAVIQTAAAIARTGVAIGKIQGAKFAGGGYTGGGYGSSDSTGFRPAGIVHEGEYVVPKWMVEHPGIAPVLGYLEGRRLRRFAEGGPSTVPALSQIPQAQAAADANLAVVSELRRLRQDVGRWNSVLRANVVYTDIETAGTALNTVRDDASI